MKFFNPDYYDDEPVDKSKLYEITARDDTPVMIYSRSMQKVSYIQGNIVAVFNDWFLSFFQPDYFKHVRIKTQSNFTDFKSFMKNIYKKDKPLIVIDPSSFDVVEDSIYSLNMLTRYNSLDSNNEDSGAKSLYSLSLIESDKASISYRRNRYRFRFDVMMMEQGLASQLDLYNFITMKIRHKTRFELVRKIPIYIPENIIINLALFYKMNYKSIEFMKFVNSISNSPIIKRITPNNKIMFFFIKDINISVEIPDLPSRDTPDMADAIELGARVTDSFVFEVDLPAEYLLSLPREFIDQYQRVIYNDPENICVIPPTYAEPIFNKYIDGYTLIDTFNIQLESDKPEDNILNILDVIKDVDTSMYDTLKTYIDSALQISNVILCPIFKVPEMTEVQTSLSDDCKISIINPDIKKLYMVALYIKMDIINGIKIEQNKHNIGTIKDI